MSLTYLLQAADGSRAEDELGRDDDPADCAPIKASSTDECITCCCCCCCCILSPLGAPSQSDTRQQSGAAHFIQSPST